MAFDSFFDEKLCPKCDKMSAMEFQTQAFGSLMNEFHVGQKIKQNGLDIWDGKAEAFTTCPKCHANLKGDLRIYQNEFLGAKNITQT